MAGSIALGKVVGGDWRSSVARMAWKLTTKAGVGGGPKGAWDNRPMRGP